MSAELSPKGRQTKEAISQAARKLFAERGFHGTTLADITSAAGKSSAVFYRYFDDKEDLLAALAEQFLHDVLQERITPAGIDIGLPDSADDDEFFTTVATGYWSIFKQNIGIMVAVAQLAAGHTRFAELQNAFRSFGMDIVRSSVVHAQQQGFGDDLDPDHIALAIALLFEQFTTVYLRSDAAALGVHTNDRDAVRTLATIWKKTLYGY
ncbi:MAG: TetR/AcrR family transcriptional regulator [Mycobacterium sp.]